MEKREFKPKRKMKGLDKASEATVKFLTLPKIVESEFETGHGPNKMSKWEIEMDIVDHPAGLTGHWFWQTTCEVVRVQIYNLVLECKTKKEEEALRKDFSLNPWIIKRDEQGLTGLKEV